ncbi:MAG TPA: SDR family oxidoreductase [Blastocatellia bacterium]|nr:SDR family oxidoreductase [Blastocatellia bacterium]
MLNLTAVRPVAFFTWNAQSFLERWARRGGLGLLALVRPLLYASNRVFATRVLHTLLRGVSQDRLDYLGEEYFNYVLKGRLNPKSVEKLKELIAAGKNIVLVSQALDHVMRPMAQLLGVNQLIANRLEFRDGRCTGRLLDPVIRPRGGLARLTGRRVDGTLSLEKLARDLGRRDRPGTLTQAIIETKRPLPARRRPIVAFEAHRRSDRLSVRESLAGKHILLIGTTGFIGKVWLAKILTDVPDIGRVYLLIRSRRSTSAERRFEKIIEESPVFEAFHERYGGELAKFIGDRVEVIEGDVSKPGLGVDPETRRRLAATLDLVVNSSGLTDFNPDLRSALSINVDAAMHVVEFVRESDHAGLLHLSTCYQVGSRDGRIKEELHPNYTPAGIEGFDADRERDSLHAAVREIEARAGSNEVTELFRQQVLARANGGRSHSGEVSDAQLRKYRARWVRSELVDYGMRRAKELGWPNTYTLTKSLTESLIAKHGANLPIAVVRPSIVETSTREPFKGWNEGVNTSAPISYLLGTYFRQLPSNERKCLDLIPVDLVCRGMTLIAVAIVERKHDAVYQLATSGSNPCDMRRSVELTGLAHRKHYRAHEQLRHRFRARFDSIPVSKERYQNLSAPRQKAVVQAIQRISLPLGLKRTPLAQMERGLDRVEKLIALYEPFILHNEQVFEAENVVLLSEALPPEELAAFEYDAASIDWWEYWINIHIPALRKWSYPLIEGRPLESRPRRDFHLPLQSNGGAKGAGRFGDEMMGTKAT